MLSDVFAACENKQTNRILAAQSLVAHLKTNPCFTRRVAHICKPSLERADDFADLRRGDSQGIESYMDKVDASAREMLFQNLLMIDVDSRRQRGETPAAEEYLSRFPSFSSIVRQTFMEDQSASLDAAAASPADMPTIVHGLADSRQLGDYELQQELGRGGFGVVYKARHQQRNDLVALKILPSHVDGQSLPSGAADRLHKFRREFRSLANINHPNLIGMQTLECEGNQWFFTMDLIDGVSFRDYVRPGGDLNEERLRHAAKQLVEGIVALHDRGIVHRDLKPSNVLVDAGGHVTILDFGLIAELQQRTDQTASMRSAQFGGTPVYAAPEQAMGERTAASDWYALGVMLYEALTGETPFRGANNVALVVKKQNEDAPLLSGSLEVPMDLAALVDQLLRRDPQQRPSASTISSTLGGGGISSLSDAPDDDSDSLVQGPEYELIGRQTQLQQLSDSLSDLIETRSPVITFVSGRSGEGKTSLVEKFLDPLRLGRDVLVLSGRCYDRESVPFKAVDTMIDAIVAFLRSRPDDDVVKYLPDDIRMLAHLFPILRRVSSIADRTAEPVQGLDDRQIRYRAFFALRDMLISVSSTTPVVMFIDDLQWGDGDSATVLFELLSPPTPPAVLFLGTYRSDEAGDSPFLKEWSRLNTERSDTCKAQKINVGPLTEDECLELVAARVGVDAEQICGQISDLFQDTRGNPYFLEQLIEGFDADSGQFRSVPLHEIIAQKLSRLPAEASGLLDAIAVAGSAASLDEVSRVAGHETPLYSTVTHMRSERLVRLISSDERQLVDTYHDKIREMMVDRLDVQKRRGLHRRIAETIEAECSRLAAVGSSEQSDATAVRVFDLAHHYYEAGDARAFAYQLQAGETALQAYAMENAMGHLEKAAELRPESLDQTTDYRLELRLSQAYTGCGRYDECQARCDAAIQLAGSEVEIARCHYGAAYSLARQGRSDEAKQRLDMALKFLNTPLPRTTIGILASSVIQFCMFHLVPKAIGSFIIRDARTDEEKYLASQIHYLYQYDGFTDLLPVIHSTFQRATLARFSDDPATKAIGYASYAVNYSLAGVPVFGRAVLAQGRANAEQSGSEEVRALVWSAAGTFHYLSGELDLAEAELTKALAGLSRQRDFHYAMVIHWQRHIQSVRGNANRIVQVAHDELRQGQSSNDETVISYARYGLADGLSRQGKVDKAIKLGTQSLDNLARTRHLAAHIARQELGRAYLMASDYAQARETLELNIRHMAEQWFVVELTVATFTLFLEASLGAKWFAHHVDTRDGSQVVKWVRLIAWRFPTVRPHALRIYGRYLVSKRQTARGIKSFDKAIAAAEKIGAEYEHARTLIDKSMLDQPDAATDRERGLELLESLGCVLPDAEVEYLGIDRDAHHDRAAKARAEYEKTSAEESA